MSSATPTGNSIKGSVMPEANNAKSTADIPAAVNAYGSCVLTWSMWSEPLNIDDIIVVSLIGLQ